MHFKYKREEKLLELILALREHLMSFPIDGVNQEDIRILYYLSHHSLTTEWLFEINNMDKSEMKFLYKDQPFDPNAPQGWGGCTEISQVKTDCDDTAALCARAIFNGGDLSEEEIAAIIRKLFDFPVIG